MFKKFLPQNDKFFNLLNELAENILKGAEIINEMFANSDLLPENASKIHVIENRCDDLAHNIISELNKTFITPIDREDIHALTNSLDDIIDSIDTIGRRMTIYRLKGNTIFGTQLSEILLSQVKLIVDIVKSLKDHKNMSQKIFSVRTLETKGDEVFREALIQLFENQTDPIELIKEKEILEIVEKAVDRCQRAAIVLESITIKNV